MDIYIGRLSCCKPNVQSIPNTQQITIQDCTIDVNIRKCFIPKQPDPYCKYGSSSSNGSYNRWTTVFISADYSQIEMRVLAHISNDPNMIQLFHAENHEKDIYRLLAMAILDTNNSNNVYNSNNQSSNRLSAVTSEMRNRAKTVTLGVIYGMGSQAAANKLKISIPAVKQITNQFFHQFNRVQQWMQQVKS